MTLHTDELAGPPLMGLGVQWDPFDSYRPTAADWARTFQRLDFMHPGFIRMVEPAYDYFGGYDAAHNPVYRWNSRHLIQLRTMLSFAKSHGIPVVLGDWSNPLLGGDPRVPAEFLAQLHDRFGYTNIRYYNPVNEPNYLTGCDFNCWAGIIRAVSDEFNRLGVSRWLKLVGPDNANSWDDTARAQNLDQTLGLDVDNPIGGDSWLTDTLHTVPGLVGAYDSHRYATVWGVENGVYEDQMRARREQISNLDSPSKTYFAGEIGLTARQVSPFLALDHASAAQVPAAVIDPSATVSSSPFIDSQPHIHEFAYGVWMADMMLQGIDAGMAGASAWDLDDAMHTGGQYGTQNLKEWGFWNSLGGQDGYPASDLRLRPWYYTWSVLARSFPAGSQALAVPSSGLTGLRVAAVKIASAGRANLSLAIVNDSTTSRSITLAVPSIQGPVNLWRYEYFASDRPSDPSGYPVPSQVLKNASLGTGLSVSLPSRGLVVFSSLGFGRGIRLSGGSDTLIDGLADWSRSYSHTGALTLDHSQPAHFNDDRSRATPKARHAQSIIYHRSQITSLQLKAYSRGRVGIHAYRSSDGSTWTPVALASTNPAPALGGGGWQLAELLPRQALPLGTDWLKVTISDHRTELSQVSLHS